MNTILLKDSALNSLWNYLQSLSLSAKDSRWLADQLIMNAERQETKQLVFTHIDEDFLPSEKVLSRVLGPVPGNIDIDKEIDLMWEERAK